MSSTAAVLHTCSELRTAVAAARADGNRIGLVPTMGALHDGHLSLVAASAAECDATIVTIFVNPTQFGEAEDLATYPRSLETDLDALANHDVDIVFAPTQDEIYPANFDTHVDAGAVALTLEGEHRPTHFRGVATVCAKLFNLAQADFAYFGQKDFQQTLVVKRIVADLNIDTEIRVCPTVREPDGLALSSRNVHLSPTERQSALVLCQSLHRGKEMVAAGQRDAIRILAEMRPLFDEADGVELDYLAIVDPETLKPVNRIESVALAAVAARVGQTRLIDNELLS
ncbi:MAG: pantoate--beta-alanine ligase [Pirellulales bacterium]|nr:pantoate--beta-alanine ligase [Pirellulales bacterium]